MTSNNKNQAVQNQNSLNNLSVCRGQGTTYITSSGLSSQYGYSLSYENCFQDGDTILNRLILFLSYMTESEISSVLNKIENSDDKSNILVTLISIRHFSESFLIDYIKSIKLDTKDIRRLFNIKHITGINSGEYSELSLLLNSLS